MTAPINTEPVDVPTLPTTDRLATVRAGIARGQDMGIWTEIVHIIDAVQSIVGELVGLRNTDQEIISAATAAINDIVARATEAITTLRADATAGITAANARTDALRVDATTAILSVRTDATTAITQLNTRLAALEARVTAAGA
jgi:uncharacterized protein YicC (UPF0701 family)